MEQYCTAHMSEVRGFNVQALSDRRPSAWRSLSPMNFEVMIDFRKVINVLM